MAVNFYSAEILDCLLANSGKKKDELKLEVYEWLSDNDSPQLSNLLEEADEYRETILHLERKVAHLEDENGNLLKDLDAATSRGT